MAAGKTSVGRCLAAHQGVPFFDLDELVVERTGVSIAALFAREGEEAFRRIERRLLQAYSWPQGCVVATGGGCLVEADSMAWARQRGTVVWLDLPFDTIRRRVGEHSGRERPLFADPAEAEILYATRREAYSRADLHVALDGAENPGEVALRIAERLGSLDCAT